jgi:argininosuccinate synthase
LDRIVLAYSGGLDTCVAVSWLAEHYGAEIVTLTLDLGQGSELADIRERALALGAVRAHVIDAREQFAREFVLPTLQAGAIYEQRYPLSTALGRPLIAKHLVRVAQMEGAAAVAHGGTAKGNDQVRIEVAVRALDPRLKVVAPAREWGMTRRDEIAYARARRIPLPASVDRLYSIDTNVWGRAIASGPLEDPWIEPPEEVFTMTRSPAACPDTPAYVELRFEHGVPVAVNGVTMSFVELLASLETIAGAHGVGRADMLENRVVGIKSREVYEAPAATVLLAAHGELRAMVLPRDFERLARQISAVYADLVYDGLWFTPMRDALDAFTAKVQDRMTGTIRLKLFKGQCLVVGRGSPHSLYDRALATYDVGDAFDHAAAEGFVRLVGLPAEVAARTSPGAGDQAPGTDGQREGDAGPATQ